MQFDALLIVVTCALYRRKAHKQQSLGSCEEPNAALRLRETPSGDELRSRSAMPGQSGASQQESPDTTWRALGWLAMVDRAHSGSPPLRPAQFLTAKTAKTSGRWICGQYFCFNGHAVVTYSHRPLERNLVDKGRQPNLASRLFVRIAAISTDSGQSGKNGSRTRLDSCFSTIMQSWTHSTNRNFSSAALVSVPVAANDVWRWAGWLGNAEGCLHWR